MICELLFPSSILAVKLNRKTLVIVLETEIYIYDISNMRLLHVIETIPNPEGQRMTDPQNPSCLNTFMFRSDMCPITLGRQLVSCLSFTCTFTNFYIGNAVYFTSGTTTYHADHFTIWRRPPILHPLLDSVQRHPSAQITHFIPLHQLYWYPSRHCF